MGLILLSKLLPRDAQSERVLGVLMSLSSEQDWPDLAGFEVIWLPRVLRSSVAMMMARGVPGLQMGCCWACWPPRHRDSSRRTLGS